MPGPRGAGLRIFGRRPGSRHPFGRHDDPGSATRSGHRGRIPGAFAWPVPVRALRFAALPPRTSSDPWRAWTEIRASPCSISASLRSGPLVRAFPARASVEIHPGFGAGPKARVSAATCRVRRPKASAPPFAHPASRRLRLRSPGPGFRSSGGFPHSVRPSCEMEAVTDRGASEAGKSTSPPVDNVDRGG